MSEYIFKNWNEFGIFYRVNQKKLETALTELDLTPLSDFSKACIATAGGCGCTKKKRFAAASSTYETAMDFVSKNDLVKTEIKKLLNGPEKVRFNHPENSLINPTEVTGLGVNELEGGADHDKNTPKSSFERTHYMREDGSKPDASKPKPAEEQLPKAWLVF